MGESPEKIEASSVSTPAADKTATQEALEQLRQMVDRNTHRWKRLIILEALGLAIAVPLGYFLLVLLLDNLVHLSAPGRFAAAALFFGSVGWFGWWLSRQWRQVRFTEDEVALAMERRTPGSENRLINAIQIARETGSSRKDLSRALIEENHHRLKEIGLHHAAKIKPALIRIAVAGLLIATGTGFWILKREHFNNAASRIMLPWTKVAPLYRTILTVEPGSTQAMPGADVTIVVRVKGERPAQVVIERKTGGNYNTDTVEIPPNAQSVSYTFKNLDRPLTYSVKGGDFSSPSYEIDVPSPPQINLVKITYHFPEYTRLPDLKMENAGGDLEALFGTRATLAFVLDQPSDRAVLLVEKVVNPSPTTPPAATDSARPPSNIAENAAAPLPSSIQPIELKKTGPTEYTGEVVFKDILGYQLETRVGKQSPRLSPRFMIRTLADQSPSLTVAGLSKQNDAQMDTTLPMKVTASDDYGLREVGLFYRKSIATTPGDGLTSTNAAPLEAEKSGDDWIPLLNWPVPNMARDFQVDHALQVAALGVSEGENIELTLRGKDTDPLKNGHWTSGETYTLQVGGEGAALQVLYEQILTSESAIKKLMAAQQQGIAKATEWMGKLDASSGLRWDDRKNLDLLEKSMKEQARTQEDLRQSQGAIAREMVPQAGNLRLSLGMLADTEMARTIRILEAVTAKENPQMMRATVAEARLTQERTVRNLQEILERYARFRQDWELDNMMPFTKMLAERQLSLQKESTSHSAKTPAGGSAGVLQKSGSQRQAKMLQLATLEQTALVGLADRVAKISPLMGHAFADAAHAFDTAGIKNRMQQAADDVAQGRWKDASTKQAEAAEALGNIYGQLRKTAMDAAQKALGELSPKTQAELDAQKNVDPLIDNVPENPMTRFDHGAITQIIQMAETKQSAEDAGSTKGMAPEKFGEFAMDEKTKKEMAKRLYEGGRPDQKLMKLATEPEAEQHVPSRTNLPTDPIQAPSIATTLEDLYGDLLKEAEDLSKKYDTINANAAMTVTDAGEIHKNGGTMNSFSAAAQTGNHQPPNRDQGGAAGAGRTGARAHGEDLSDKDTGIPGMPTAKDGQENTADQPGVIEGKKDKKDGDGKGDTSVGTGGKKVKDEQTKFSTHEGGQWKDNLAGKMEAAKDMKKMLVDSAGKPIDPNVAAMLNEANSSTEQLIERVKSLKKELKNLYLPTDSLTKLTEELSRNLERLKEKPSADLFRIQQQTLVRLGGELIVVGNPSSGFQPSVPRPQTVKGRVLDEPAWQTTPGYEEAVKYYYEKLSVR